MIDRHAPRRPAGSTALGLVLAAALFPTLGVSLAAQEAPAETPAPRLVLQITVDQLRGDLIRRYLPRMGEGGFRRLLAEGVVYEDAHHAHANTETIVGHATLATGADPAVHGLIGNTWFDRTSGGITYNIEDARYPLLTAGADVDASTEIDPTQRAARTEGRSPAALLCTTFSDELAIHTAGRAKIFGVSVKDRGAVSMAGHAGQAYWFSKSAGSFVTSRYYRDEYPEWVEAFRASDAVSRHADTNWELLLDRSEYIFGDRDDQPWETDFPGYGRTFPHPFGPADGKYFTTRLTLSPVGDRLVLAFAKELVHHESLGADEVPDYLSVSFSSTDYVGHLFGPSSLEAEDNLLRLDRTIAELLAFIDERVGLDATLVVLSADHGGPEVPGHLQQSGIDAGYVEPEAWDKSAALARLKERFGIAEELIRAYNHPYVYLNLEAIARLGLDRAEVETAVAAELRNFEGIAAAVPSSALTANRLPDDALHRAIRRNHHPGRSGDVFVVFDPHWFIRDFDGLSVAATHGSPWSYDTYVPVVFLGAGLDAARIHRRIHTTSLAPTLSLFVGAKPPSGSTAESLVEVLGGR